MPQGVAVVVRSVRGLGGWAGATVAGVELAVPGFTGGYGKQNGMSCHHKMVVAVLLISSVPLVLSETLQYSEGQCLYSTQQDHVFGLQMFQFPRQPAVGRSE